MENQERKENYTFSESFELPSKGLIYDVPVEPKVELRSMTARDEMKRLSPSATPLKTLADIIENCLVEKPAIHVYDMIIGDYEYLLHKLRIVTYGSDYPVSVTCTQCGETIDTVAKLDEIKIKPFNKDEFDALRTIILPDSKQEVRLNFQTPRLLDNTELKAKEMKRKVKGGGDIDYNIYAQLLAMVDTVDNKKLNSVDLEYFINDLSAKDMNKMLNANDKLNAYVGLDNLLSLTCSKCGENIFTFFRFGPEFFRPSNI